MLQLSCQPCPCDGCEHRRLWQRAIYAHSSLISHGCIGAKYFCPVVSRCDLNVVFQALQRKKEEREGFREPDVTTSGDFIAR